MATRVYWGGLVPPQRTTNMEQYKKWQIGDLIKIVDCGNLGVVIKEHQKAGIPFYLIYDSKTHKQSWYPYYSISQSKTSLDEEKNLQQPS